MRFFITGSIALAVLLVACSPPEQGTQPPPNNDAEPADGLNILDAEPDVRLDSAVNPLDTGPDSHSEDMTMADTGPASQADGGVEDATTADAAQGLNNCESACSLLEACDNLGEFSDTANCMAECERISRHEAPSEWYGCLELEACNLLHLCPFPEAPPLDCEASCGLVQQCEGAPEILNCIGLCDAGPNPFNRCAESLDYVPCRVDAFTECLERAVEPRCNEHCEERARCRLDNDGDGDGDCYLNCVNALHSADALTRRRAERAHRCTMDHRGQCLQVEFCQVVPTVPDTPPNQANLCPLWEACFPPPQGPRCEQIWETFANGSGEAPCLASFLQHRCPASFDEAFDICVGGDPVANPEPDCTEYCDAITVCDHLEPDEPRAGCIQRCTEALASGEIDIQRSMREQLRCTTARTCNDFGDCLDDRNPGIACEVHCTRLRQCQLAPEACEEVCVADFYLTSATDWRQCAEDNADRCLTIADCEPPPGIDCSGVCQRLGECGLATGRCNDNCREASYLQPESFSQYTACVLGTAVCSGTPLAVDQCERDRSQGGRDCYRFCAQQTECDSLRGLEFGHCVDRCGAGFIGEELDLYLGSLECLRRTPHDSECAAFDVCVPEPGPTPCAVWCAGLESCEDAPADCLDDCEAGGIAAQHASTYARCVVELGGGCEATRTCLGPGNYAEYIAEPDAVCTAWRRCNLENSGPCQQALDQVRDAEDALQCIAAELRICPPDPFPIAEACMETSASASATEDLRTCERLCAAQQACGPEMDFDRRDCMADCFNRIRSRNPEERMRLGLRATCQHARTCSAFGDCLERQLPGRACEAFCGRLRSCGLEEVECDAACNGTFFRERNITWRSCVDAAEDDCLAMRSCTPEPAPPCDTMCQRLEGCRIGPEGCRASCDNTAFRAPEHTLEQMACVFGATFCARASGDTITSCLEQISPRARQCQRLCDIEAGCIERNTPDYGNCLLRCGEGQTGTPLRRARIVEDCVAELPPASECPEILECVIEGDPGAQCDIWCEARTACGLDLNPGRCLEDCAGDPLAQYRAFTDAPCMEAAIDCDGVRACRRQTDWAPIDPVTFCTRYRQCGLDRFLPCEALAGPAGLQPGQLQCVFDHIQECPNGVFPALAACGPDIAAQAETEPLCQAFCRGQHLCGALGLNERDCQGRCMETVGEADSVFGDLVRCRQAETCAAISDCVQEIADDRCADICRDHGECLGETCRLDCLSAQASLNVRDPARHLLDCMANADHAEDCGALRDCLHPTPEPITCNLMCGIEAACTRQEGRGQICIQGCQGLPAPNRAHRFDCLERFVVNALCDMDGYQQCLREGP